MKKFAKKHLAIAVFMMAFGGMTNMAHAAAPDPDAPIAYTQDISADKEVKQGGAVKVEFAPSADEIISGKQKDDVKVFVLKVSDSADHAGWELAPTGQSEGGKMYSDKGDTVKLKVGANWEWDDGYATWHVADDTNQVVEGDLYVPGGAVVKAGVYHFTGQVREYVD